MITQDYLKQVFDYKGGNLYWKIKPSKKICIGDKAGCLGKDGYFRLKINKSSFLLHRVIFMYHNGWLPTKVDHSDCNTLNNKIENLRPATAAQSSCNRKIVSNNTSGYKNICWHKASKKWIVRLTVNGKQMQFGTYHDIDYAKFVADAMRHKYHKEFARHK